jgi:hypothetical protein
VKEAVFGLYLSHRGAAAWAVVGSTPKISARISKSVSFLKVFNIFSTSCVFVSSVSQYIAENNMGIEFPARGHNPHRKKLLPAGSSQKHS